MVKGENGKKKVLILFNAISTKEFNSLSGGDRIVVELFKRWQNNFQTINVVTCNIGKNIFFQYARNLKSTVFSLIEISKIFYQNIFFLYLYRTIKGLSLTNRLAKEGYNYIYSSSDFWPDSIPAFWAKIINPKVTWIASFYMFAPNPLGKDSPYKEESFLKGLFYYLTQLPIYLIIKNWADFVLVTSEPDVKKFITPKRDKNKIIVVQGGVDITESEKYLADKRKIMPLEKRKYDACFIGRFHYQKGVLELIDIWENVCSKISTAKLAMIGTGPLEVKVKEKINKLGLNKNVDLLGFKDGNEKYEFFKNSKIILHPATYDSGGMAAAEGMAWGLPGVSFDLPALKSYYPRGMIKTKCFDLDEFTDNILRLLNNHDLYNKMSENAHGLIIESWSWDKRAKHISDKIFN